jgi:hypothetical protein
LGAATIEVLRARAETACRAAVMMSSVAEHHFRTNPNTMGMQMGSRVGVHMGPVTAGVIESLLMPRWHVFGETVHYTDRIQHGCRPNHISISKIVRDLIKGTNLPMSTMSEQPVIIDAKGIGHVEVYEISHAWSDASVASRAPRRPSVVSRAPRRPSTALPFGDRRDMNKKNSIKTGKASSENVSNESDKASSGSGKASNESGKASSGSGKASNESGKASNESGKASNESGKASNESGEISNESGEISSGSRNGITGHNNASGQNWSSPEQNNASESSNRTGDSCLEISTHTPSMDEISDTAWSAALRTSTSNTTPPDDVDDMCDISSAAQFMTTRTMGRKPTRKPLKSYNALPKDANAVEWWSGTAPLSTIESSIEGGGSFRPSIVTGSGSLYVRPEEAGMGSAACKGSRTDMWSPNIVQILGASRGDVPQQMQSPQQFTNLDLFDCIFEKAGDEPSLDDDTSLHAKD